MSSVTRFIRQIPVSTTYYDVNSIVSATGTVTGVYEFYNDGSNYVGNYPPGYVLPASLGLQTQIINAADTGVNRNNLILRDMGKTIYAAYGTSISPPADPRVTLPVSYGYFRQVQLLKPTAINSTQGTIGGTGGSTFGVLGAALNPDPYTDYLTFYISVTVAGVRGPAVAPAYAIAGGQM